MTKKAPTGIRLRAGRRTAFDAVRRVIPRGGGNGAPPDEPACRSAMVMVIKRLPG
jgi:hypothetical protein